MKELAQLLREKNRDFLVIKAHADGPKLFVAFEVFVHASKEARTYVVAVDLETLATEVVFGTAGSSVDYLHRDGWHGLVQRDAVVEYEAGTTRTTRAAGVQLVAIARAATTTLVCGAKTPGDRESDGFLARVADGELEVLLESSKMAARPGRLQAITVGPSGTIHAGGNAREQYTKVLLFSGTTAFMAAPVGIMDIYSLHERRDGGVLVGCHMKGAIVEDGTARPVTAGALVYGVTEFRGTEYWLSHAADRVLVATREGDELVTKYKTKFQYPGYRSIDGGGAPDVRMTATDDRLVVTNKDRIHLFDGTGWDLLRIMPSVKKLVKRMPPAMK